MARSYKDYLRAAGVKPIKGNLRTSKPAGSIEIAYDPRTGDYERFEHEGEASNVVPIRRGRAAA